MAIQVTQSAIPPNACRRQPPAASAGRASLDKETRCHPVRHRPALVGAGRRPGRHVKRTLTPVRTLAVRAVVCSARPGRRRAGWLRATTRLSREPHGLGHPGAGAPPPEARRLTHRGEQPGLWRGVAATSHVKRAAGRLPAPSESRALGDVRSSAVARGYSLSAPADGRRPGRRRATAAAAARRPIGGACGPFRAALEDVRKVCTARQQPAVVLSRDMLDSRVPPDA
jgi:hypothetical protein